MMKRFDPFLFLALSLLLFFIFSPATGQELFTEKLLKNFTYRSLGPYRAGSWVTSIAVPEKPLQVHLYTFYIGTRNGGVWKTVNNGTTFEPVFDGQSRLSIGDLAVAPSNSQVIWVGTGESYCTRSSHSGDGVYKSVDGGKTWTPMGLPDSHHIARIIIHPRNPEVVYVAAMGHLFTPNAERGVFKTIDGGRTWKKVLYINDKIGVIDLVQDRRRPEILYAAAYDKVRLPWHYEAGGPESAVFKTENAGKSWRRLSGGLPTGRVGRIGLDLYRKNPDILYAIVENANPRPATLQEQEQDKRRGLEPRPRTVGNEVYRTDDGGRAWRKVNPGSEAALDKAPYSFNQLRLDQNDPGTVYITGQSLASTNDAGQTWKGLAWPSDGVFQKAFGDWRTLWVDPQNSDRLIFGSDGGIYISYDRGLTCHHCDNLPLGEFYALGLDMEDPYNIYGGLQDHDSWKAPSLGWAGAISLSEWVTVGSGDGMYNQVDPLDSRWVYNNREFGAMWRLDQKLGLQADIRPRRTPGQEPLRFNWTPPILLSPLDPAVVYVGAQVLFRSSDRGDHWTEISPDLTTNDKSKQAGAGNITFCTITTLAESSLRPGVIWVGTDDGKVQVTIDGGATWKDRTPNISAEGGPENFWVSRVFASAHEAGTAFAAKTGLRFDDFRALLFKTTDYGETWTSLAGGLPEKCVNVVVQDRRNPGLLFVGTEQGVYVSLDGGKKWVPFKNNMPWVKVTDLAIHPRQNDLVVATFGRGLYITDIAPLQEMNEAMLQQDVFIFEIKPAVQRIYGGLGNYQLLGDDHLLSPNEPNAVVVNYYLKEKAKSKVKITVSDAAGQTLAELDGRGEAGVNTVLWDMRPPKPAGQAPRFEDDTRSPIVDPGSYSVKLDIDGRTFTKKAVIVKRMGWSLGPFPTVIKE